jgi:Flp pilus assembly protein TadG
MLNSKLKRMLDASSEGSNLVEFALVLIILVLLLAAIGDFGRAFNHYIVITNASREGARFGARVIQTPEIDDWIREAVIREAANSGVDLEESMITIEPAALSGRQAGSPITVTVEYTVRLIFSGIVGLDELPMRSQTVMMLYASEDVPTIP